MSPLHAQFVVDAEKTDTLLLRNGDLLTGDFRELSRGLVSYKTDAMSTINVKWTRVLTATTEKQFEIHLDDGRRYVGSIGASDTLGRVVIRAARDTVAVTTLSIVEMQRLKSSFWNRLDGSFDLGFDFTQQNKKVDLNLRTTIYYLMNRNRFSLSFDGSFSRQDSATDISRSNTTFLYSREFSRYWFAGVVGSLESNSQLSLDRRVALGVGPGRFFVFTNRIQLGSLLTIGVNREQFEGEDMRTTVPLALMTDFQFFNWSGMSTDVGSRFTIQPILNDPGRWRIIFTADLRQEIMSQLYLSVGIHEQYDSEPPSADANKNDFSLTTSLGWTF